MATLPFSAFSHFFFVGLNDQLFEELNRRLKSTGAAEYIQSLKELYVDFMGKDTHIILGFYKLKPLF